MSAIQPHPERTRANTAIVLTAAGSGTRLGQGIPKARVRIGGLALVQHAFGRAVSADLADTVVVTLPEDDTELWNIAQEMAGGSSVEVIVVPGAASRSESVSRGLEALPERIEWVLVHDAARCFTPAAVFTRVARALEAGAVAVVPALPVVDTVKKVSAAQYPHIAEEEVAATLERDDLRLVQTPQGFHRVSLLEAHERFGSFTDKATDDAVLMAELDMTVHVVEGDDHAFKVTRPFDLLVAEAVAARDE